MCGGGGDNKKAEYLFRSDINKHNNNTHHKINRLVKAVLDIFIFISQALSQRPQPAFITVEIGVKS